MHIKLFLVYYVVVVVKLDFGRLVCELFYRTP